MNGAGKKLVLFTAEFPFGNKSETFLETEIPFLAKYFDQITIVPSHASTSIRDLPKNIIINRALADADYSRSEKIKILFANLFLVIRILFSECKIKGFGTIITNIKHYFDTIGMQLIKADIISGMHKYKNREMVMYDYWFQNSTLALAVLKEKNIIRNFISRGHGYDIYDERNLPVGIMFREWIMQRIHAVFIVSQHGVDYFSNQLRTDSLRNKVKLSRLGVSKPHKRPMQTFGEKKMIVSCSSLLPFKQVERIPLALAKCKSPIHWIHFGDGITRNEVEKNSILLPKHITFELKGHLNNEEIIHFYQNHSVNLFISLSISEGLPVSMMEAQSFGIPILAYPIGGIPELVIPNLTGFLLEENFTDEEICQRINEMLSYNFDRNQIVAFFNCNFNAEVNYTNFIHELCSSEE